MHEVHHYYVAGAVGAVARACQHADADGVRGGQAKAGETRGAVVGRCRVIAANHRATLEAAPRAIDEARRGLEEELAIGVAAHGIGTARAFQLSEQTGAFAALAMGLNGLFTALTLPWLLPYLAPLISH